MPEERTTKIGIDLGTTNSCCYCINARGEVMPVPMPDGSYLLPSSVFYDKGKDPVLGNVVKSRIKNGKLTVVRNSKRLIGRKFKCEEVQSMLKSCGAPVSNRDGNPVFDLSSIEMEKTPEDVAVDILQFILTQARKFTDSTITDVCITIPARFDNNQRTATINALKRCGFSDKSISILSEPSAATATYINENPNHGDRILVFDFGGGTFDVSIVNIANGDIVVETNRGNNTLGGVDIDKIVLDWMKEDYERLFHKPLKTSDDDKKRNILTKLLFKAEETKIRLSTEKAVEVSLEGIPGTMTDDGDDATLTFTRASFEIKIKPILEAVLKVVEEALNACHLKKSDIRDVVFVGGSTRIPILKDTVYKYFDCQKVKESVNPDDCVSKGACLSFMYGFNVIDRASYSLGQLISGSRVQWVIPLDCLLPAEESVETKIVNSNMDIVLTYLYQGNSTQKGTTSSSSDCIPLAPYYYDLSDLEDIEDAVIRTTFKIQGSGIVYVSVVEINSNTILLSDYKIEFKK